MSYLWTHPRLSNPIRRKLDEAMDANPAVRAKAVEPFPWIVANNAAPVLFTALSQCAQLKATTGLEGKPAGWLAPPPAGIGNHIGIVLCKDDKGEVRCFATNSMAMPEKTSTPCPAKFAEQFQTLRSKADQAKLIQSACAAAASDGHLEEVAQVAEESQRYRTMPIFLVVLTGNEAHMFATPAIVDGPRQVDLDLQFTGKVVV